MQVDDLQSLEELVKYRWDARALRCLGKGQLRFRELAEAIRADDPDIGDGMLSRTLRRLEQTGLATSRDKGTTRRVWVLTRAGRTRARRLVAVLRVFEDLDEHHRTGGAGTDGL